MKRLTNVGFIRKARYVEWLSNVVLVIMKSGKLRDLRVCIDFRNLNLETSKDKYPMAIVDLLIDGVIGHKILSFMDQYFGYNKIFIAKEDAHKIALHCPGNIGTFEWVVIPLKLKNASAIYKYWPEYYDLERGK